MNECALWRRLDQPGHDAALLTRKGTGWLLSGTAVFGYSGIPHRIQYTVEADSSWRASSGLLDGFVGSRPFKHTISHRDNGWYLDEKLAEGLEHLVDLDYGFTPATNIFHMRRMNISPGQTLGFPTVWFDVGRDTLAELPQLYHCVDATTFRYTAESEGYCEVLKLVRPKGFIESYPNLWILEASGG